jgi:hypothetical protein
MDVLVGLIVFLTQIDLWQGRREVGLKAVKLNQNMTSK